MDARSLGPALPPLIKPLEQTLQEVEKDQIQQALEQTKHNRTEAARLLGLTRAKLYRRIEALGIPLDPDA